MKMNLRTKLFKLMIKMEGIKETTMKIKFLNQKKKIYLERISRKGIFLKKVLEIDQTTLEKLKLSIKMENSSKCLREIPEQKIERIRLRMKAPQEKRRSNQSILQKILKSDQAKRSPH